MLKRRSYLPIACLLTLCPLALCQDLTDPDAENTPAAPQEKVEIDPTADDEEIAARLTRILEATEWFDEPSVQVEEGIAFLSGRTDTQQHKEWAGNLAANTEGVVSPVNRITVQQRSMWDLSPAWEQMGQLAQETVQIAPLVGLALVLLAIAWLLAGWAMRGSNVLLKRRLPNDLLRNVTTKLVALVILLLGVYLVLRVSGLTRLALTVLGGTGIIGLVIGIGFRDIAENFLASILISMHHPFRTGDLIKVAGFHGYVQQVNSRSTLLMTLDGNHVQIPNATIYKETIVNYYSNPHMRCDFGVGIGYDDSVAEAQSVGVEVLRKHPAVLNDPPPSVLVEGLGTSTVNLRCYYWIDVTQHSEIKTLSAVLRLTKRAFQQAGISMPDEAREIVFPDGVPLIAPREESATTQEKTPRDTQCDDDDAHAAEGTLASESAVIEQQARQARLPEEGRNLLED